MFKFKIVVYDFSLCFNFGIFLMKFSFMLMYWVFWLENKIVVFIKVIYIFRMVVF